MEVKKTTYGTEDTILYNLHEYVGRSITISDDGVTANADGKKIVKAGSIVDKTGKIVNDGTARYVVLQNVDVTKGVRSATGIYIGSVHASKLPVTPSATAKAALKGIFFMEDDSNY